jgi:hypothetical protein
MRSSIQIKEIHQLRQFTTETLAEALSQAAKAHHEHEQSMGSSDANWATWYASWIMANFNAPITGCAASGDSSTLVDRHAEERADQALLDAKLAERAELIALA